MVANQPLYEKVETLVRESLAILESHFQESDLETNRITEYFPLGANGVGTREVTVANCTSFLWNNVRDVEALPEYKEVVELMNSDKSIRPHIGAVVGDLGGGRTFRPAVMILDILDRMSRDGALEFDQRICRTVFEEWESFFHTKAFRLTVISPLIAFASQPLETIKTTKLGNGLVLRRITDEEFSVFYKEPMTIPDVERLSIRYVIEFELYTGKSMGTGTMYGSLAAAVEKVNRTLSEFLFCLRCVKANRCGIRIAWLHHDLSLPFIHDRFFFGPTTKRVIPGLETFSHVEIQTLKKLHTEYVKKIRRTSREVKLAIRRFNSAFERDDAIDAFLDLVISIEIMFGDSENMGDITFRLASRLAKFIEDDYESRQQVFKMFKEVYRSRGKLVHRGREGEINELQTYAMTYALKAIQKFLIYDRGTQHSQILSRLDLENELLE